jgi:K+ transporter
MALTLGALGIVFGDIGTSPLYALKAVFTADITQCTQLRGRCMG